MLEAMRHHDQVELPIVRDLGNVELVNYRRQVTLCPESIAEIESVNSEIRPNVSDTAGHIPTSATVVKYY
jgi:hypothetical protein